MTRALLQQLVAHLRWADSGTGDDLCRVPGAPANARRVFMHVLAAEHLWLCRLEGVAPQVDVWPTFTVDACRQLMADNHGRFERLLTGDDASLARVVSYQTTDGRTYQNTVLDILVHVAMHGSWHRGQVAWLSRDAGMKPFASDYIAFVRGGPAAITKL